MKISILVPSRGRPAQADRLLNSLKTAKNYEVLFYLNDDDIFLQDYLAIIKNYENAKVLVGPDSPPAWSWNILASKCFGDLMLLCGDDCVFTTDGWDDEYRKVAAMYDDGIVMISCDDGRSTSEKKGNPHPCLTRTHFQIMGYFVNPIFLHWNVDTYTERMYERIGRLVRLDHVKIEHIKAGDKQPHDETSTRIRKGVWPQRDAFVADLAFDRYIHVDIEILRLHIKE
jgi:hypothetical protein